MYLLPLVDLNLTFFCLNLNSLLGFDSKNKRGFEKKSHMTYACIAAG